MTVAINGFQIASVYKAVISFVLSERFMMVLASAVN